jgi:hypothetical protein
VAFAGGRQAVRCFAKETVMKNFSRFAQSTAVVICAGFVFTLSDEGGAQPPAKPAELKVLERFIGKWKFEMIAKPAEWTPKEMRTVGTTTNEWVLDGWFQHHKVKDDQGERIDVMTYDPRKKTYRSWSFDSNGYANEMTGDWDEKSKTLTTQGDFGNGITAVAKMLFIDNDNREVNLVAKDVKGKIYLDIRGKLSRQK